MSFNTTGSQVSDGMFGYFMQGAGLQQGRVGDNRTAMQTSVHFSNIRPFYVLIFIEKP